MNWIKIVALGLLLSFGMSCTRGAAPEPNASRSEQTAREVRTPSGGGPETANRRSVPERAAADNVSQGSAVPPAAADQTRPHPQQQRPEQRSSTSSAPQR